MDSPVQQAVEDSASIWRRESPAGSSTRGVGLAVVGGILGALAASSCCVLPLVLFTLGVSGAWIGNVTALAPYQPIFIALTLAFLGYGFYWVYRRPKPACAEGSYCASPKSTRLVKIGLWSATILVVVAFGLPKLAPLFVSP